MWSWVMFSLFEPELETTILDVHYTKSQHLWIDLLGEIWFNSFLGVLDALSHKSSFNFHQGWKDRRALQMKALLRFLPRGALKKCSFLAAPFRISFSNSYDPHSTLDLGMNVSFNKFIPP